MQGERPPTWNKFYAGKHWTVRSKMKDRIRRAVTEAVAEQYGENIPQFRGKPVDVTVRAYYKHHPADSDNIADKLYIDALVEIGIIVDDDPRYVRLTTTQSIPNAPEFSVEIQVTQNN